MGLTLDPDFPELPPEPWYEEEMTEPTTDIFVIIGRIKGTRLRAEEKWIEGWAIDKDQAQTEVIRLTLKFNGGFFPSEYVYQKVPRIDNE